MKICAKIRKLLFQFLRIKTISKLLQILTFAVSPESPSFQSVANVTERFGLVGSGVSDTEATVGALLAALAGLMDIAAVTQSASLFHVPSMVAGPSEDEGP